MTAHEESFLRKTPKQSRSRAVVDAVLQAAEQVVGDGAASRLSLESIAKRAGVGIGSLYDYFAGADSVWGALVARFNRSNFEQLEAAVRATEGAPLHVGIEGLVTAVLDVYLAMPERTRFLASTLFRLNWVAPVVQERDRFAEVLLRRALQEWPHLEVEAARLELQVLCDAIMGVVLAELWRARSPGEHAQVRAVVRLMVARWMAAMEAMARVS